jgi:hypothetical protein
MRKNRIMATIAIGVAVAASAVSVATIALADPAAPGKTGQFATWRAAENAAGFRLVKPTKTYGLAKASDIIVARCEISKKEAAKRNVIGQYGLTAQHSLVISQNNANAPCVRLRKGKSLGTVRVSGVKAYLTGDCDIKGLPSCTSTGIFLFLTWRAGGIYYQASSYGEPSAVLAGFARGLVRV